jgi:hypothetical protein
MLPPLLELADSSFTEATMNQELEFSIDPQDSMVTVPPSDVIVTITDPRGFAVADSDIDLALGAARGRRDGRLTYQYTPTEPGIFQIDCRVASVTALGFPVSCIVAPKQGVTHYASIQPFESLCL